MKLPNPPICPKCGQLAILQNGAEAYPHRPDLAHIHRWTCIPCGISVGVHPGTTKPLGTLADKETHQARMRAHAAFDPLWKGEGRARRHLAYQWLSKRLGVSEAHIGCMDIPTCDRVVQMCIEVREKFNI